MVGPGRRGRASEFAAALPTLKAIATSFRLDGKLVAQRMADNWANYFRGLRDLSNDIARFSEQRRRENLQLFIDRGRAAEWQSYNTTRMIMEDSHHYLAGYSGYVVANQDGLFHPDGTHISHEPWGESITRNMDAVDSRRAFEHVFRNGPP
jgi:hypothetical protein